MAYSDDPGMRGLGASGGYGDMPPSMYMRKIETTDYYEDPETVNNHFRDVLRDTRPDAPWLAAHEPRSGEDRGGGFGSKERLSLRHSGSRSGEDPYLPDGTFLDHEFAERDPRGHATGPDMRKHRDQQFARASLIKKYNDDDFSVPESGIAPSQMVANIRSGQQMFKDRYTNFETGMDNFHTGGTTKRGETSQVGLVTLDGTITDLSNVAVSNRRDATAILSGDPQMAYRHSTPDHRVKVAKYGKVRANKHLHDNDWKNNRLSSFQDHNMVLIDGQMVNRKLAHLILDLQGARDTKQEVAKGADYGDSYNNQVRRKAIHPEDIGKLMRILGVSADTQPLSSHARHDGKMVHRHGRVTKSDTRGLMKCVQVNHEIVESMTDATRKVGQKASAEDLRAVMDQVIMTSADNGIYLEQSTKRAKAPAGDGDTLARESFQTHFVEDGKQTKNYAGIKPSKTNRTMPNLDYEAFAETARETKVRQVRGEPVGNRAVTDHEYGQDQDWADMATFDRATRADPRDHTGRHQADFGDMERGDATGAFDYYGR
jgi:hypothetical protein